MQRVYQKSQDIRMSKYKFSYKWIYFLNIHMIPHNPTINIYVLNCK